MSQEAVVRPLQHLQEASDAALKRILSQPKPTFRALDEAMVDAANSVDKLADTPLDEVRPIFAKLRDQLFLSPRLSQWQSGTDDKGNKGYWLKSKDQSATITVREDKVVLSTPDRDHPKYPFNYDVVTDSLAAATLFKNIQDAQAIIQPQANGMAIDDDGEEFFGEDDPEYFEGAGLDAALVETHADPLVEDDAELIEEVTTEEAQIDISDEDEDEDDAYVDAEIAKVIKQAEELKVEIEGYSAKANRKNIKTDGVQCEYCGNLNKDAYKGTCPQCPKDVIVSTPVGGIGYAKTPTKQPPIPGRDSASEAWLMGRLKSMQGRVLTILDASPIADKAQRDAVKTLINKEFRREMNRVSDGGWRAGDPRYEE